MNLFDLNTFDFYYVVFMLFVVGAVFGSFLNVVILRAFTEESIVLPPSKCPKCHNKLKWYHNIPILSYLFLRGKCGFCHEKISIQYPIVEFLFAVIFTAIFLKFGLTLNAVFLAVAAFFSLAMTVTDIKESVIFDGHAYILAGVGLIYNFFNIGNVVKGQYDFSVLGHSLAINRSFVSAILGIILAVLLLGFIVFVFRFFFHKRAFGSGDSFILGALGAVFGVYWVLPIFFYGMILQAIAFSKLLVKKMLEEKDYFQLGAICAFLIAVGLHLYVMLNLIDFSMLSLTLLLVTGFIALVASLMSIVRKLRACPETDEIQDEEEEAASNDGFIRVPFGPALIIAAWILLFSGFQPYVIMLL